MELNSPQPPRVQPSPLELCALTQPRRASSGRLTVRVHSATDGAPAKRARPGSGSNPATHREKYPAEGRRELENKRRLQLLRVRYSLPGIAPSPDGPLTPRDERQPNVFADMHLHLDILSSSMASNDSRLQQQPSQKDAADQNFDYMFKLLIIGNSSVGKTSFLFRYADDSFTSAFVSTVGIDFKVKTVFRNDKRIKLQIWFESKTPVNTSALQ
ncbi:Ras-related protein Rab-3 [Liparis tanakae]|uniref:small monomeric GTPase n=1 Tax=Liparis tanakae TaxID=230148 RepID=A0A4Z2FHT0_9TELE|nr:Ras-related protein Rab-3 [Liparis tanakae]